MKYIATFFSHFGAVRYKKICEKEGVAAVIMPVPRNLSSSCGTCVQIERTEDPQVPKECEEEIEQIVEVKAEGYRQIYRAENS